MTFGSEMLLRSGGSYTYERGEEATLPKEDPRFALCWAPPKPVDTARLLEACDLKAFLLIVKELDHTKVELERASLEGDAQRSIIDKMRDRNQPDE